MNNKHNKIKSAVVKALKALGYRTEGNNVRITEIAYNRYQVFHNDRCIGIWDAQRNTFVD